MPAHDWTRVEAGIFHDFHHAWIEEIKAAFERGLLPDDYYALAERRGGFGESTDLQGSSSGDAGEEIPPGSAPDGLGMALAPPNARVTAETDMEFYAASKTP